MRLGEMRSAGRQPTLPLRLELADGAGPAELRLDSLLRVLPGRRYVGAGNWRGRQVLAKLLVTPTPRVALVAAKAFAAGVRALVQALVVLVLAALLGVGLTANPLKLIGMAVVVVLGSAFFCCLSITIAGLVLSRDRLMGIGQAITMPLFFGSNALYPISVMPGWLRVINRVNPLGYEVDALRGLLIGTPANLGLDFGVLVLASVVMISIASALLARLAR